MSNCKPHATNETAIKAIQPLGAELCADVEKYATCLLNAARDARDAERPSDAVMLAEQAADAWKALAYDLARPAHYYYRQQMDRAVSSEKREPTPIGLFWQTADGRWHFSPGAFKRDDIHDNGRPIHIALLGEEAK